MSANQSRRDRPLTPAAVRVFAAGDRMNQLLIEHLDRAAWCAKPPGGVRTIAAIFTHMHNVRAKWVRLNAPDLKTPTQLSHARCSPEEARKGLAESAAACMQMLTEACTEASADADSDTPKFRRDGWGSAWPVGVEMLCYMVTHEAHHRGQVCLLAHLLGFPLSSQAKHALWNWEKLWKDCGFPAGPGH